MQKESKCKEVCPICLATVRNAATTSVCAHRFCHSCLLEWTKTQNTCPICKQRFDKLHKTQGRLPKGEKREVAKGRREAAEERKRNKQTVVKHRDQEQLQQAEIFGLLEGQTTRSREIKLLQLYCFLEQLIEE